MSTFVIDASIAVKWVVDEPGSAEALRLRRARLIAPGLLIAECANILWKKSRRLELSSGEAILAARLLQASGVEIVPERFLLESAAKLAVELNHPAYDCVYLALALEQGCRFATADARFVRKVHQAPRRALRDRAIGLGEAAAMLAGPGNPG